MTIAADVEAIALVAIDRMLDQGESYLEITRKFRALLVRRAVERSGGNLQAAARELKQGINTVTYVRDQNPEFFEARPA